jgi:hypothetical protein
MPTTKTINLTYRLDVHDDLDFLDVDVDEYTNRNDALRDAATYTYLADLPEPATYTIDAFHTNDEITVTIHTPADLLDDVLAVTTLELDDFDVS